MQGFFNEDQAVVDIPKMVVNQYAFYFIAVALLYYNLFGYILRFEYPGSNPQPKGRGGIILPAEVFIPGNCLPAKEVFLNICVNLIEFPVSIVSHEDKVNIVGCESVLAQEISSAGGYFLAAARIEESIYTNN